MQHKQYSFFIVHRHMYYKMSDKVNMLDFFHRQSNCPYKCIKYCLLIIYYKCLHMNHSQTLHLDKHRSYKNNDRVGTFQHLQFFDHRILDCKYKHHFLRGNQLKGKKDNLYLKFSIKDKEKYKVSIRCLLHHHRNHLCINKLNLLLFSGNLLNM